MIPPPTNAVATTTNTSALRRAFNVAIVAAAFVLMYLLRVPICPFAIITRHPCPGCGLTRAGFSLLQGDLHEALHLHPLVIPIVPIVALVMLHGTYNYVRWGRWYTFAFVRNRMITIGSIVLMGAMIAVWIARFLGAFGGPVAV